MPKSNMKRKSKSNRVSDPPQADQTLKTFELFSLLPYDLRFEIWNLTLIPQVLDLYYAQADGADPAFVRDPPWKHFFSDYYPLPPILLVCRESRQIALTHYTRGFDMFVHYLYHRAPSIQRRQKPCQFEREVRKQSATRYWDSRCDAVYLREIKSPNQCGSRSRCQRPYTDLWVRFDNRLRYLVIDAGMLKSLTPSWICCISGLRSVFLILDLELTWAIWRINDDAFHPPWWARQQNGAISSKMTAEQRGKRLEAFKDFVEQLWSKRLDHFRSSDPSIDLKLKALEFVVVEGTEQLTKELELKSLSRQTVSW